MGFSKQEYSNGLPFPSPGALPDLGIKPKSLKSPALQVDSLPTELSEKPLVFPYLLLSLSLESLYLYCFCGMLFFWLYFLTNSFQF